MMIIHKFNPVIFELGFFQLRWYSIMYIVGLVIAFFIITHIVKERGIKLTRDEVIDYIVYLAMGLLIGGRVLYFVFYDFNALLSNPLELFKLWNGGMSFHGGLVGALAGGYVFVRKHKLNPWEIADITVIPLGIALFLGRIGNFINGELYGRVWDGVLCVDYSQNEHIGFLPKMCRYPSQLAEAAKNLVIFAVIWSIKDMKLPNGFLFWSFVTMYGVLRFTIEFIREPDVQLGFVLGPFTMGQVLSSLMVLVGGFMLIWLLKHKKFK